MQQGAMRPELKEAITGLGLEFRLMTQFTSFVAVEEMIVSDGGQPRRIDVPVEVPEGVNRATTVGQEQRPSGTLRNISAFSVQTSQAFIVTNGYPPELQELTPSRSTLILPRDKLPVRNECGGVQTRGNKSAKEN